MTEDEMFDQSVHGQMWAARKELATLKREHEQLRAAAKDVVEFLVWPETNPAGIPSEFLNNKGKKLWRAIRAAIEQVAK